MDEELRDNPDEIVPRKRSAYFVWIALGTAVAIFLLSMQAYFYLIRPQPVNIPKLEEVTGLLGAELQKPFSSYQSDALTQVINETRDSIKQVANFIASKSCSEADPVCQSKALFYFVRDEINYVPDDRFQDQLENPLTVLKTGGADCEDMAVLLIALEKAIGNKARLVFVPGHAYGQISIPGYRGEKWLNMEVTCKDCQFGELPNDIAIQKKDFREI